MSSVNLGELLAAVTVVRDGNSGVASRFVSHGFPLLTVETLVSGLREWSFERCSSADVFGVGLSDFRTLEDFRLPFFFSGDGGLTSCSEREEALRLRPTDPDKERSRDFREPRLVDESDRLRRPFFLSAERLREEPRELGELELLDILVCVLDTERRRLTSLGEPMSDSPEDARRRLERLRDRSEERRLDDREPRLLSLDLLRLRLSGLRLRDEPELSRRLSRGHLFLSCDNSANFSSSSGTSCLASLNTSISSRASRGCFAVKKVYAVPFLSLLPVLPMRWI